MRIVVDQNIPGAEVFARHGEVIRLAGRNMQAADVRDADALIVRSITKVGHKLLQGSKVSFVGTCTIGTDHLDIPWLDGQEVAWSNAPGCNARSVVEYVLAALRLLSVRKQAPLAERCFGIVGVGEVGQRLANLLQGLGYQVLLCDPPRQHGSRAPAVTAEISGEFVSLDSLLEQADVICLHTPLIESGNWPTRHMLDAKRLERLRPGSWLLNAGRGPVIDNSALYEVLQQRKDLSVVLDVWEHEPRINSRLAAQCDLVTPHVAGYSLDGKIRGTELVYQAFCRHFALPVGELPEYPAGQLVSLEAGPTLTAEQLLLRLSALFYEPLVDDAALRATLDLAVDKQAEAFDVLRKNYPERREMPGLRLLLPAGRPDLEQVARALELDWAVKAG